MLYFAQILSCFSHFLVFLLHPPLLFFSLLGWLSCSEELSLSLLTIRSSTGSLRNSWDRSTKQGERETGEAEPEVH
jgi:hypothetical protein